MLPAGISRPLIHWPWIGAAWQKHLKIFVSQKKQPQLFATAPGPWSSSLSNRPRHYLLNDHKLPSTHKNFQTSYVHNGSSIGTVLFCSIKHIRLVFALYGTKWVLIFRLGTYNAKTSFGCTCIHLSYSICSESVSIHSLHFQQFFIQPILRLFH